MVLPKVRKIFHFYFRIFAVKIPFMELCINSAILDNNIN